MVFTSPNFTENGYRVLKYYHAKRKTSKSQPIMDHLDTPSLWGPHPRYHIRSFILIFCRPFFCNFEFIVHLNNYRCLPIYAYWCLWFLYDYSPNKISFPIITKNTFLVIEHLILFRKMVTSGRHPE
jgi:hypothetical protein